MAGWQPSAPRPGFLRQRWRAARAVPLLVWGGAVFGLFWLGDVTPGAQRVPALADTASTIVLAPVDGRIATLAVQLHQLVEADQVIARLDDRDVRLRLTQANYELERLRADMARVQADVDRDARMAASEHGLAAGVEHRRLLSAVEAAQLGAVATRAELEEARIRMQGAAIETDRLSSLATQGITGEPELLRVRTERDALKKRVDELQSLYDEHRARIATAQQRLADFAPGAPGELPLDTALAPLRWRLKEQEAQIERIALDAQSLDLRSPIRGHVSTLEARAGEWATSGRPIVTVVDPTPRRILAWVPDTMRARFENVRSMQVRRADSSPLGSAQVLSISPTAVKLPERLWRDPQREEWGYEVVIAATGAELPGERLLLTPDR
ncbi:MAG: HlyD family efflux transporter periplasmic adaptor subunit [Planctomycetota bacterium]